MDNQIWQANPKYTGTVRFSQIWQLICKYTGKIRGSACDTQLCHLVKSQRETDSYVYSQNS